MSALNTKRFKVTPPDQGSFPLDHEGICKEQMQEYMKCLIKNKQNNSVCRKESKAYLDCRMNNDLMTKQPWSKLGFSENENNTPSKTVT